MTYLCYCHIWQSLERVDHRIMEGPGRSTFFFVSRLLSHAIPCPLWNFAFLLSSSRVISSFHNFSVLFSVTQICNLTFMALLWLCHCLLCVFLFFCDFPEIFSLSKQLLKRFQQAMLWGFKENYPVLKKSWNVTLGLPSMPQYDYYFQISS